MVAAANPLAVEAGLKILKDGGSAVDAAIAVQTVLGLVEPQSSGIGGGAFMIVYDNKTGEVWFYDGREAAPSGITPELFYGDDGEPLRYFEGIASGRSTGVPSVMVMLAKVHGDYGSLAWGPQMDPAIKLADDGFAISPRMAGLMERAAKYALSRQETAREYFFDADGNTHPAGFIRDNKPYAASLRALQKDPRALLKSPIADDIIAAVQEEPRPGVLTKEDMAKYEARKRPALCSAYRTYTICGPQPPSSGGIAVQSILGTLENFDMAALGPTEQGWHVFAEASFLSYTDRDRYVADDQFVEVPVSEMLSKDYLAARANLIQSGSAMTNVTAGNPAGFVRGQDATPDSPGTSHFTIVDKDGLVVSMTTTVESVFGSQRMAAGFMLNNQLTDFSFRTHDADGNPIANAPAPNKRPRSSMSPTIVFDDNGEFLFSTGSPGGSSIIAYTAKTIVGILDWGMSPQEAIDLPNITARRGSIRVEEKRIDPAISLALEGLGHKVVRSKGENSGLHIIYRNPDGSLIGGADPRREGVALTAE
jgi:gamma-glutamyltranspeptidase/glutathione hydrolase